MEKDGRINICTIDLQYHLQIKFQMFHSRLFKVNDCYFYKVWDQKPHLHIKSKIKSKNPLLLPVYIISGQKYTTYQKKLNT